MSKLTINTRREFLSQGLGLVGVGAVLPYGLINTAMAAPKAEQGQRVTVILQLAGGHDALSALVPYGDPEYNKSRIETRINEKEVLKLDDYSGLHPNMKGIKALHEEGQFAAIPGVGYPDTNFSHFTATDIWETAQRNPTRAMFGWVGKACDSAFKGNDDPKLAIAVGAGKTPRALVGKEHPGLSFSNPDSYRYTGDRGQEARKAVFRKLNATGVGGFSSNADFIKMTAGNANASSDQIRKMAKEYKAKVDYPNTPLGRNLKTIAALIVSGLSTRIYHTQLGGFDTHSGQRLNHDRLMIQLDEAITAFYKDLKAQGQSERVLTMTMSEFGRRVKENGSRGTDHGAASALFMFGPGVKSGIHGKHPSLTDLQGGGGGSLKHTVDFRSVYASVIDKWIGGKSEASLGAKYPHIDCIA
ncbi:MAG: DUF1501 domain-containing protein [Verrucomicrobiales bacterium]|nr:DUF1501 domain-containing protein [Verrucomicrobiales bacterium]